MECVYLWLGAVLMMLHVTSLIQPELNQQPCFINQWPTLLTSMIRFADNGMLCLVRQEV